MRVEWFLFHVASGHAYFSGLALISVAVAIASFRAKMAWRPVGALLLVGVLLVAISATPAPWFVTLLLVLAIVAWLIAESRRVTLPPRRLRLARIAAALSIVVAIALETPYHLRPRLEPQAGARLAVIGDSVTAGIGENEAVTWPQLVARSHSIEVNDVSEMGATVKSAQKQADRLDADDTIVVLEIGGNDLLGETSVKDFATELERLLRRVCVPGRTVVMFELPLPPSFNAYGRIQRRLAGQYRVELIPKRVLMSVLTGPGATLDTIHLSQAGHDRFAEAVWRVIGGAFADEKRR